MTTPWTITEVPEAFAQVSELADRHGYVATLFGSTLKQGSGNDLDVVMVSRMRNLQLRAEFLSEFGGFLAEEFHSKANTNHGYKVERDGKLYHFIFGRF